MQPTENVSLLALPLLSVHVQSSASPSIIRYVAVPPPLPPLPAGCVTEIVRERLPALTVTVPLREYV